MKLTKTLLLTGADICGLISDLEYIDVVERAFRMYAEGKTLKADMIHIDSVDGEFHVKAGGLRLDRRFVGLKINGDFPHNMNRLGTPNLRGLILLCSGEDGSPLAIMDSREITTKRTGAATAVAAKHLANPNSEKVTICGCGVQGRSQLRALTRVLPIKKTYAFNRDRTKATRFADEMSKELGIVIDVADDLEAAVKASDVCVTCTRSEHYFIANQYVLPGTFVAAVGADSPDKQELDPELLVHNTVVVDILAQCVRVGELHHALKHGMTCDDVYAELGEIVAGKKPGRRSSEEIIVFDSTGTALQDVAVAAAVYERALRSRVGRAFDFVK